MEALIGGTHAPAIAMASHTIHRSEVMRTQAQVKGSLGHFSFPTPHLYSSLTVPLPSVLRGPGKTINREIEASNCE